MRLIHEQQGMPSADNINALLLCRARDRLVSRARDRLVTLKVMDPFDYVSV